MEKIGDILPRINEAEPEKSEKIEYFDDRFYKLLLINETQIKLVKDKHGIDASKDAIYLPSSTTLLGLIVRPYLLGWYGDVGTDTAKYRSEKAKQLGSHIHEHAKLLFEGGKLLASDYKQEAWVQLYRIQQWFEAFKPEIMFTEHTVYSLKHFFAGTLDLCIYIKGGKYDTGYNKPIDLPEGKYILDLKTGKGIDSLYYYQLASYKVAHEEMTGDKIIGTLILHTQADTKKGWKVIYRNAEEVKQDFDMFTSIAKVWKVENKDLTPKIFELPAEIQLFEKEKEAI